MLRFPLAFGLAVAINLPVPSAHEQWSAAPAQQGAGSTRSSGTIRGRITLKDNGAPARHVMVSVVPLDDVDPRELPAAETDNNGDFRMPDVPVGRYFLYADLLGYVSPVSLLGGKWLAPASDEDAVNLRKFFPEVKVENRDEVVANATLEQGAVIRGKALYVSGSPATSVPVALYRKQGGKVRMVAVSAEFMLFSNRTDERGVYHLPGLPPGDYYVRTLVVPARGEDELASAVLNRSPESLQRDVTKDKNAAFVHLEPYQEVKNVDLKVVQPIMHTVSGQVVLKDGQQPVEKAVVSLQVPESDRAPSDDQDDSLSMLTDSTGKWDFIRIPDGVYTVSAHFTDWKKGPSPGRPLELVFKQKVTLEGHDQVVKIELAPLEPVKLKPLDKGDH